MFTDFKQVHSSRGVEREAQRNIELMWQTGRLAPGFKTIVDFRKFSPSQQISPSMSSVISVDNPHISVVTKGTYWLKNITSQAWVNEGQSI